MARNLIIQTIKAFKGIDVWSSFVRSSPERALDCLNVIPSSSGGLEKLRIPPPLSTPFGGLTAGPDGYTQYQQAGGLRQVMAQFNDKLIVYHADWTCGPVWIDARLASGGVVDYIEASNLLFGTNLDFNFKWDGTAVREWGILIPDVPPTLGAPIAGPLTFTNGGRRYRVSYGSSLTGHVSNASPISASSGNLTAQAQPVTFPASGDAQADLAYLWSTVDGGGDFYLNQVITIAPLSAPSFSDTVVDANLNTALIAPLINNGPPLGKYLARFGGRIFIGNLDGDPQTVAYSGYERILVGRPEESFPPNNRLKLAIGADPIGGMGAVANGLVIFSRSNEMFILRGVLQDITVSAPIQLTAFLQPMPWTTGCASHFSIAETPHGLVWLASDHTIQLFDGQGPPVALSTGVGPLLRRLTPGREENARGAYFKYLEREWYALTCAIDGSLENNFFIVFDLDPNPETNVGAFPSSMNVAHVEVIEATGGVRQLTV